MEHRRVLKTGLIWYRISSREPAQNTVNNAFFNGGGKKHDRKVISLSFNEARLSKNWQSLKTFLGLKENNGDVGKGVLTIS